MKDKQYRLSKMKYQLADRRRNGVREVMRKLNDVQLEYVTEVLGYQAIPYLYRIQTRRLKNYRATKSSLLKELHHAKKAGKKTIVKNCSHQQLKVLEEYDIRYWIEKYRVILT